ncbi:MAG TPA: hypothetical protein VF391_11685 [Dermatophilaceae bacterium]
MVAIFPARGSLIRLVGAVLAEQHHDWIGGRRGLGLDFLARSRLRLADTQAAEDVKGPMTRSPDIEPEFLCGQGRVLTS